MARKKSGVKSAPGNSVASSDDALLDEASARVYAQVQAERPLGWRPELPNAAFPLGYACAGDVAPPELADILQGCEPEDFSQVLQPMTMDDFDALLLHHPGITGLTYRASSREHRLVYLHLVNRVILSAMSDEVARCGHCSYPEVGRGARLRSWATY